jgi:putative addiction module component (TIGR02574 family)
MSDTLEVLTKAALKLSADERAELAERLIASVEPPEPLHPAWEAEIARRIAALDAGRTKTIPGDQVFAELRATLDARDKP